MVTSARSKLWVRGGPFDGCGISLLGGITTMGRESTNDIVVEHPVVSRQHARVFSNAQGYWIQDLGSQNGTFVNRERIGREPRLLKDGERIQLGSIVTGTRWEFSEVQEAAPELQSQPTVQIPLDQTVPTHAQAISAQRGVAPAAQAQPGKSPCEAFRKNDNGSWTCKYFVAIDTPRGQIEVSRGTSFIPGTGFMGFDVAKWLDENCI